MEGTATQHLPEHWIQKVMVLISIPGAVVGMYDHQVVRLFKAWAQAEGGGAKWDPLNTTDHLKDSFGSWQGVDWNTIGVAQFTSPFHGIVATAATLLENTAFQGLLADMRSEDFTAEEIVSRNEGEIQTWGTNPELMITILKGIS